MEEYQWDSPSELEQDNSGILKNVKDTRVVGLFFEVYWGCSKKSLLSLQLVGCTGIWGICGIMTNC